MAGVWWVYHLSEKISKQLLRTNNQIFKINFTAQENSMETSMGIRNP